MRKKAQKDIERLAKIFLSSRDILLDKIIDSSGAGTKTYYNTVLKQLNKEIERLQKETGVFIDTTIPEEYKSGLDDVYNYFTRNNLMMRQPNLWAQIHTDAVYGLAREMQYQISQGIAQAGRQVLRYLDESRDEALRQIGLEATAEKMASGSTVLDMKRRMVDKLQSQGFMTVQYGEGKNAYQVPIDTYAAMVARSTTREAGNMARENQLTENGHDLVEMSTHYPTCKVCAQYQGRVYSISGNDKRFPPLSLPFASGYHNIHPNCRHVVVPWIESLQEPEEIQAAIAKSNQPFEDSRPKQEIDLYNAQQAQNRQMRQDLYQYERYRARLGEDAPKSFHAFRRLKKAGGDRWGILEAQYKGMGYYDKAVKNEPQITKAVLNIAENTGMEATGLEFRIKSKDSYLRKIKSNYSTDGNEYEVKDILRYTLSSDADTLTEKTMQSIDGFGEMGYNTIEIKNYWVKSDSPYNGVNTVLTAPNGQRFEVQYHTPEGFALKNGEQHILYEKQRLITDETSPEFIRLQKEMFSLSDRLVVPDRIEEVENR